MTQHTVEERIAAAVAAENARIMKVYEGERQYAIIGREVLAALKKKGALVGAAPSTMTAQVCAKYAAQGKDFDVLMDHVKSDVMLMSEWERFCMWLKMGQED